MIIPFFYRRLNPLLMESFFPTYAQRYLADGTKIGSQSSFDGVIFSHRRVIFFIPRLGERLNPLLMESFFSTLNLKSALRQLKSSRSQSSFDGVILFHNIDFSF